jgi:hypothetical protein
MKGFLSIFALVLAVSTAAGASTSPVFDELMAPYEKIRFALSDDSLEGVADEAASIRDVAAADVSGEAEEIRELLPEIAGLAADLAESSELAAARDAFYELSKLLVRYRANVDGERPEVVYCAMAKKSWLQPPGDIGNPYYGPSMQVCGEVVEE